MQVLLVRLYALTEATFFLSSEMSWGAS